MYCITSSKYVHYDYEKWISHFCQNDRKRLTLDFSQEEKLSEKERRLLFKSIIAFQEGEGSDGKYLLKAADNFAESFCCPDYSKAMELFIKEENWHSSYLSRYMKYHGVRVQNKNPLDKVFRRLRKAGGIRSEITVLVTAEIIALAYYTALSKATNSILLKRICKQMLKDELPHIVFQSYTLSFLPNTVWHNLLRIFLMGATTVVVWIAFGDLLLAGGYSFDRFLSENLSYLRQSIRLAKVKGSR